MHKIHVQSTSIAMIGYDGQSETLEVVFLDGAVYHYFDVPMGVADEFMYYPPEGSHGKYFHAHIRGVYQYIKIHGPET